MPERRGWDRRNGALTGAVLTGAAALVFSVVYLASDLVELSQGGFSTFQLALTYVAEAAIPLFVLGLYTAQRPQIGRLGLVSALAYAYAFVFFAGTVTYALIDHTADWSALEGAWGPWITLHSILMILSGVGFGSAVIRARVLPRWTGMALVAAMVLMAVTVGAPDAVRTAAAGVRDLAFAGMGASLLMSARPDGGSTSRRPATHRDPTPGSAPLARADDALGHALDRSHEGGASHGGVISIVCRSVPIVTSRAEWKRSHGGRC